MDYELNRVVEIDLTTDPYEFVFKYEVFFNADCDDLIALARENEADGVWTINILTCPLEEADDYSALAEEGLTHCLTPIYAGELEESQYRAIVNHVVGIVSGGSASEEIGYYSEDI